MEGSSVYIVWQIQSFGERERRDALAEACPHGVKTHIAKCRSQVRAGAGVDEVGVAPVRFSYGDTNTIGALRDKD